MRYTFGGGSINTITLPVSDDFTRPTPYPRAMNSYPTSSSGHTWVLHNGDIQILSPGRTSMSGGAGSGTITTATLGDSTGDTGAGDVTVQATQTAASTETGGGLMARFSDVDNYFYFEVIWSGGTGSTYRVRIRQSGSFSTLWTGSSGSRASGDVMKIVALGISLDFQINGSSVFATTSTHNETATKHGLCYTNYISGVYLDDFSIT